MTLPTLTRRALIAGAGTAIASAAVALPYLNAVRAEDLCSVPVDQTHDPLLEAITAYRQGLADFEALRGVSDEERDAYATISYAPRKAPSRRCVWPPRKRTTLAPAACWKTCFPLPSPISIPLLPDPKNKTARVSGCNAPRASIKTWRSNNG